MGTRTHIVINGRTYDTTTGLPTDQPSTVEHIEVKHSATPSTPKPARQPAKHRAAPLQHSTTLRRDIVAKPQGAHDHAGKHTVQRAHVAKSPSISKFAPHIAQPKTAHAAEKTSHVIAAVHHKQPVRSAAPKPAMTSRELKDHLIATKLAHATPNTHAPAKKPRLHRPAKVSSIMAACFAIMLLGGYLSYINMPHLSVRVAASQAGVNASFPNYTPNGYSFHGPVAYTDGQVTLGFAANGGTTGYTITEKKSQFDSQSVLDNVVATASEHYDITQAGGLTIYTYNNHAAWVNAGTLYTISGDAPLGPDQVVKIAQSL